MIRATCPSCGRDYHYPVDVCSFCRAELASPPDTDVEVLYVTRVDAPSIGHEDVPYWVALARDADGGLSLRKSDREMSPGDRLASDAADAEELDAFGILGGGTMGAGLVELLLQRGHRVAWVGRDEGRLARGRARVLDRLARVMDAAEADAADARLTTSTEVEILAPCDVVVEAVVEDLDSKAAALARAETAMRDDAILATNTSGLPLDELADVLRRPERFGALHFFNPPTRMKLVETAVAPRTDAATSERLDAIARSLGKVPVRVAATPAFAVNRTLMPLLNEAVRALEEGVADASSIDEAVHLGLNHPLGPLALADLIGLDVVVDIMENLADRTSDDTYRPRPMLTRLVAEGRLGRKTGGGFYDYDPVERLAREGGPR